MNPLDRRDLAGIAIALLLVACVWYLLSLLLGLLLIVFATLGPDHWHWWFGLGLVGLTVAPCAHGGLKAPARHRCQVTPLPAPRERIKAMGGNYSVPASDRWAA